jgi:hypothetical protein
MERQLWKAIVNVLNEVDKPKHNVRCTYSAVVIVKVWMWAVIHDRPVSWACQRSNWPPHEQRWKRPSCTTMSRRLRSVAVRRLLEEIEQRVLRPQGVDNLVWIIDGKPLVISGCSKDRQAGYGRAAGGKAKGYKIHAIVGSDGSLAQWRVAPMNKDERVMARRMIATAEIQGYLLADSNYDSNKLHQACDARGNLQLVARRRYGPDRGHGHRQQTPGRMRSKELLETPFATFGEALLQQREEIERYYGNLANWGGGLTHLPPWARTHRRVHRWVQAKFVLNALKPRCPKPTYVN